MFNLLTVKCINLKVEFYKKRHLLIYLWNKCLAAFKPTYLKVRLNKIGDVTSIKCRKIISIKQVMSIWI
jgi:hypothetical protein